MTGTKVPLMIYGNPNSTAGFQALFYLNNPTFTPPSDTWPSGMAANDFFFIVNISPAFTNITLIQNNVKSFGASRDGRMKIAMAIPKGMRLRDGKSPYDVLLAVRNAFIANHMDASRTQPPIYRFHEKVEDAAPIQAALDRFELEPVPGPHREMRGNGQAFLRVPASRMPELFKDLQYPEFGAFKEIIVAETGEFPNLLPPIAIPRPIQWRLTVNGRPESVDMRNYISNPIEISDNRHSPEFYDNTIVKFTVPQAERGEVEGVFANRSTETIEVSLIPRPKKRVYKIQISGAGPELINKLGFRVGGRPVRPVGNEIVVEGENIRRPIDVACSDNNYRISFNIVGDNLIVNAEPRFKPREVDRRSGNLNLFGPSPKNDLGAGMTLTLNVAGIDSAKHFDMKMTVSKSKGENVLQYVAHPRFQSGNGASQYMAEIQLPGYLEGQATVQLSCENMKARRSVGLSAKHPNAVSFVKDDFAGASALASIFSNPAIVAGMISLALIVGLAIGWLFLPVPSFMSKDKEQKEQTDEVSGKGTDDAEASEDWWKEENNWKLMSLQLNDDNLSFTTIERNLNKIIALKDNEEAKAIIEKHQDLMAKYKYYEDAVNAIREGNVDKLKGIAPKLNQNHARMAEAAYQGWWDASGPHYYNRESLESAKERFEMNRESFGSFKEIEECHNGLSEFANDSRRLTWEREHSTSTSVVERTPPTGTTRTRGSESGRNSTGSGTGSDADGKPVELGNR